MMNELRMYVERLFEGKVLTAGNIELKEEIYGNLVARYEDLVKSGMPEKEALERTMEGITSVDDLLGATRASGIEGIGVSVTEQKPSEGADVQGDARRTYCLDGSDSSGCVSGARVNLGPEHDGRPSPPEGAASSSDGMSATPRPGRRRMWPLALVGCLSALVLLTGIFLFGLLLSGIGKAGLAGGISASDGDSHVSVGLDGVHLRNGDERVDVTLGDGLKIRTDGAGIAIEPDGTIRLNGDVADELIKDVVNSTSDEVLPYVGTSLADAGRIGALMAEMPMGQCFGNLDVTLGEGVLAFDYLRVPQRWDEESVDVALAYNVTALLCAMPELREIRVNVTESEYVDDVDHYVFTREAAEELYGAALNAQMVNEAGWHQIKNDNLYRSGFAGRMIERAESDGR